MCLYLFDYFCLPDQCFSAYFRLTVHLSIELTPSVCCVSWSDLSIHLSVSVCLTAQLSKNLLLIFKTLMNVCRYLILLSGIWRDASTFPCCLLENSQTFFFKQEVFAHTPFSLLRKKLSLRLCQDRFPI